MQPNDAFLLFFKGLARHAPGTDEATLRALAACDLGADPVVYDLGAGTGSSALVLAEHLKTKVVAVDVLERSLEELRTRAERRGIDELIETRCADFMEIEVAPGSVDLAWSEGAIYTVGWTAALKRWRKNLRDGGYVVASEPAWVAQRPVKKALDFWSRAYPEMRTIPELEEQAVECGYELIERFALSAQGWSDYYAPLAQRVALVLGSNPTEEMREVAEAVRHEIDVWEEHPEAVDFVFFVLTTADTP